MGEINIPYDQQSAIAAIDIRELERLIEKAILEERLDDLLRLPFANCGPYIATQLRYFERGLAKYRDAKAPRKREETKYALRRAASDLSHAVLAMKRRVEVERQEAQFFRIDDQIRPPYSFGKQLDVRVSYQWRRNADDEWKFGHITFIHKVDSRPDYTRPPPKRKPSRAKRERKEQEELYRTWEHLVSGALYSVRDYFRRGGDGDKIPDTFQAVVDAHTRGLNNYSTEFWR